MEGITPPLFYRSTINIMDDLPPDTSDLQPNWRHLTPIWTWETEEPIYDSLTLYQHTDGSLWTSTAESERYDCVEHGPEEPTD